MIPVLVTILVIVGWLGAATHSFVVLAGKDFKDPKDGGDYAAAGFVLMAFVIAWWLIWPLIGIGKGASWIARKS